ncbi:2-amino-4-hydroxy-6-hydroxymethyldihydropteridine diphosphokinase [Polymorphobacter multimanifer]|uniref:2-amino-4-hydroxy-6-hydroxymethyldihydropteridine pyrophosphokinase n=1 Tax=Polymorphobacter multimanifer TaxID=1070431 RepID=A0A841L7K0_9SPHN|nr:2-amino-4-hydroxy-6-hydroxymethyldihydropteridine diphosphokinase [Polymorphobacter multimanifer]MBB6228410.1 2-amino-4-hydroxy-6-hydroxymethyldihydropteridine diphosphokinase [Polymorphobacter multimanifer]
MGEALALIGLGSNRRHGLYGRPEGVLRAAVAALLAAGLRVERVSKVHATAPMGPGGRRFANAVLAARWGGDAHGLLALVKAVERDFGRRGAQRWGDRVLDLDVLALGDVVVREAGLVVPHAGLAVRRFVLAPLVEVAPGWRHPVLGLTARQLHVRALRPKRAPLRVGP